MSFSCWMAKGSCRWPMQNATSWRSSADASCSAAAAEAAATTTASDCRPCNVSVSPRLQPGARHATLRTGTQRLVCLLALYVAQGEQRPVLLRQGRGGCRQLLSQVTDYIQRCFHQGRHAVGRGGGRRGCAVRGCAGLLIGSGMLEAWQPHRESSATPPTAGRQLGRHRATQGHPTTLAASTRAAHQVSGWFTSNPSRRSTPAVQPDRIARATGCGTARAPRGTSVVVAHMTVHA